MELIEVKSLKECESIIEKGLSTFVDVGRALMKIRDDRLYRETHRTFEEYCKERWGMSRIHAHRLIEGAKVTEMLPIGNKPATESQARPLTKLPPAEQPMAFQKAVAAANQRNETLTARHVEEAVNEVRQSQPKKEKIVFHPVSDAIGFAVIAITNLECIRDDDPKMEEAFTKVETWIQNKRRTHGIFRKGGKAQKINPGTI